MTANEPFNPARFAALDRDARRIVGKPAGDCTIDDLDQIIATCEAETTRDQAQIDQAAMTAREAKQCGCTILVPLHPDGTRDLSHAIVNHTCGKAKHMTNTTDYDRTGHCARFGEHPQDRAIIDAARVPAYRPDTDEFTTLLAEAVITPGGNGIDIAGYRLDATETRRLADVLRYLASTLPRDAA